MPTRTAFVIAIGTVLESHPPRRKRLATTSSSSSQSNDNEIIVKRVSRRFSEAMKTRTLTTPSSAINGNDKSLTNGTMNGVKKGRHLSADQVYGTNGPLSPRTRSVVKQEIDEEVSFVEPVLMDNVDDKNSNGYIDAMNGKKKRKSANERFLEDNSDYYKFQVFSSKLRSTTSTSSSYFHNSVLELLQTGKDHSSDKRIRPRPKSSSSECDSSGMHGTTRRSTQSTSDSKRPLKILKTEDRKNSSVSEDDEDDSSSGSGKGSRRSYNAALSPSSKRRRSELDKLLEAGSSSFHAKELKLNGNESLGPIHVDVCDSKSASSGDDDDLESSHSEEQEPKKVPISRRGSDLKTNARLLQTAETIPKLKVNLGKRVNSTIKVEDEDLQLPPKKKIMGRPPKAGKRRQMEQQALARQRAEEDVQSIFDKYLPNSVFNDLEIELSECIDTRTCVDSFQFSFERVPIHESWYETYYRQDQGNQYLFYQEPESFRLPYEMQASTFYPKRIGVGKKKRADDGSSNLASLNPSGAATPVEDDFDACQSPWARGLHSKPSARGKRAGNFESRLNLTFDDYGESSALGIEHSTNYLQKLGPRTAAALREFSRKSPRGHASTRSLFSGSGEAHDTDSDVENHADVDLSSKLPPQFLDECSNDSLASHFSRCSNMEPGEQDVDPDTLDEVLRFIDHELKPLDFSPCHSPTLGDDVALNLNDGHSKKKSKRRSKEQRHHKHHRKFKDLNTSFLSDDPIDRIVAANVDEILLDCLEDELPSVMINNELPGSDPLELIENYQKCDAMSSSMRLKPKPRPFLCSDSKSSLLSNDAKERHRDETSSSPLLKQLLTSPKAIKPVQLKISSAEDSSSEYASACETLSVASTNTSVTKRPGVRKKKRNATGFPATPKRKSKGVSVKLPSRRPSQVSSTANKVKASEPKSIHSILKRTPRDRAAKTARLKTRAIKLNEDEEDDESPTEDSSSETQDVFQPKPKKGLTARKKAISSRAPRKKRNSLRASTHRRTNSSAPDDYNSDAVDDESVDVCEEDDHDNVDDTDEEDSVDEDEEFKKRPKKARRAKPIKRRKK